MHALQPKHIKLKPEEIKRLLDKYNISISQLPKIKADDPALGGAFKKGDILRIERREDEKINVYYRAVI